MFLNCCTNFLACRKLFRTCHDCSQRVVIAVIANLTSPQTDHCSLYGLTTSHKRYKSHFTGGHPSKSSKSSSVTTTAFKRHFAGVYSLNRDQTEFTLADLQVQERTDTKRRILSRLIKLVQRLLKRSTVPPL